MAGFGVVPKMPYVHTQVPFGRFGALLAIPSFAAPDSVPQVESRYLVPPLTKGSGGGGHGHILHLPVLGRGRGSGDHTTTHSVLF